MNTQQRQSFQISLQAFGLLGLLMGALSFLFIPMPSHTFLWKAVNNFAHVPLFGIVAIMLLVLSRMVFRKLSGASIRHYIHSIIGVVVLALSTEALQTFAVTRQPQMIDVGHDLLGAMCGLGVFMTYDMQVPETWARWKRFPRDMIIYGCVLTVLGISLIPVAEWTYAYWDRASRFPSLLEFTSDAEMKFVQVSNSELHVVPPPQGWRKPEGDKVGHLFFYTTTYPGFRIEEPYSDWRGFRSLRFDMYSELPTSQAIGIRIDDVHHNRTFEDRFNRKIMIFPGLNHIQIPIDDIRFAPKDREMDLRAISRLLLFTVSPAHEFSLFVDSIRLE